VFLEAIQYFAHTGDIGCLLAPQRMLLGIHNVNGDTALHTALLAGKTEAALSFVRVMTAEDLDVQNSEGLVCCSQTRGDPPPPPCTQAITLASRWLIFEAGTCP
jgi:hypothetical protein